MKKLILLLLLSCTLFLQAQEIDTSFIDHQGNKSYYIHALESSSLLIFLHGGVNNPAFNQTMITPEISHLTEGNIIYTRLALQYKFDVLLPVTNDSLDWLNHPEYCFKVLQSFIANMEKKYDKLVISGFSDGGTGSYKVFYEQPDFFDGLVVFNGYPQHANFYKKVDYSKVHHKKVVFFSTYKDQIIPYEFLLTEYAKQKEFNPDTYVYVKDGKHRFDAYGEKDIDLLFNLLSSSVDNKKTESIHALIRKDEVIKFYPFRKKVLNKFGYGKVFYEANQSQQKQLKE